MTQESKEINYFTADSIALRLGISVSAVNKLINRHYEDIKFYMDTVKIKKNKRTRRCRVISEQGLMVLLSIKNNPNKNNLKNNSKLYPENVKEMKKQVIEKAINKTPDKELSIYGNDPIVALRVEQLRMQDEIKNLQETVKLMEQTKHSLANTPITYDQRQKLSEWVRCIAIELNKPFNYIWSSVHLTVGKRKVDYYSQADFETAKQLLKNHFEFYKIKFND